MALAARSGGGAIGLATPVRAPAVAPARISHTNRRTCLRAGFLTGRRPSKRSQQASVFAFGFDEPREEGANGQSIHVAGMDAGQQRFREIRRGFEAEATRHERSDRFIALVSTCGHEQLGAHSKLAEP